MSSTTTDTTLHTTVWSTRYWFVALTTCLSYPDTPTDTIKQKYYDLYQNIFLFLPHNDDIRQFYPFITRFPITPYLDSRSSLLRWLFFMHNQISDTLNIQRRTESELLLEYRTMYRPVDVVDYNSFLIKRHLVGFSIVCGIASIAYLM